MMALEAIREIVGLARAWSAAGDGGRARYALKPCATRDPANPLNGDTPTITDLSGYAD